VSINCGHRKLEKKETKEVRNELNAIKTLEKCNKLFFPLTYNFLYILVTFLVYNVNPERSFSTLKCLKAYLRNNICQE